MPKSWDKFKPKVIGKNDDAIYLRFSRQNKDMIPIIVGCGGSGSWIALTLALQGVKEIILIDDDIVEIHNLNRTPYKILDVGSPKVQALADLIAERRSTKIIQVPIKLTEERQLEEIAFDLDNLSGYPIFFDCTDGYEFKRIFSGSVLNRAQVPYLKVGYDGTNYDIDGSNEYIFDSGYEGYQVLTTSIGTTLQIASKIAVLATLLTNHQTTSTRIRILGNTLKEIGIDEVNGDIKTMVRGEEIKAIENDDFEVEDDFEYEVVDVSEERERRERLEEEERRHADEEANEQAGGISHGS